MEWRHKRLLLVLLFFVIVTQLFVLMWGLGVMDVWVFRRGLFYSDCPLTTLHGCTMQTCFDFDRCDPDPERFRLFVYPDPPAAARPEHWPYTSPEYQQVLTHFRQSRFYTPNASEACVFLPSLDTLCQRSDCGNAGKYAGDLPAWKVNALLPTLEHWGPAGRNHIVLEWHDSDSLRYELGEAIAWKNSYSSEHYRFGFDVTTPAYQKAAFTVEQRHAVAGRDRLLSWCGTFNNNNHVRRHLATLHNGEDIVILGNQGCDYTRLMTGTRYALVPRGNGLHTHRLLEALAAGAVPVIVAVRSRWWLLSWRWLLLLLSLWM